MPSPAFSKRFGSTQIDPHPLVDEYLTAAEFTHDWANLTGWTTTGVQVSGNRLYGISGGNPVATAKPFAVAAGEVAKVTAEIVVQGSAGGAQYVGFNFGGTNDGVLASLPNFVGIGIGSAPRYPQRFVGANFSGVTTGASNLMLQSLAGQWRATVVVDAINISIVLQREDGGVEYSEIIPRSAAPNGGAITSIIVWNGANTGTAGHYVKAIGAKKSLTPFRTKLNAAGVIEGDTPTVVQRNSGSDNWRIQFPAVMDGMRPAPLAVFFHQATTGDRNSPMTETRWELLRTSLLAQGYVLASADDGGDRWGNPTSVANYAALAEWVQAHVYTSKVCLIGASMGGLPMFNTISHRGMYPIAAAAGISPVCDLIVMRENASFTSAIDTAWGSSSEATLIANSAGYDPLTTSAALYRRVPCLFNVGSADATVPAAEHSELMAAHIALQAVDVEYNVLGSGHLQVEQYDPNVVQPFLNRYAKSAFKGQATLESVTGSSFSSLTTAHVANNPATVNAGDMLLYIVAARSSGAVTVATPTGLSRLFGPINAGGANTPIYGFLRIADGSEGATTLDFVTSATATMAVEVRRVSNSRGAPIITIGNLLNTFSPTPPQSFSGLEGNILYVTGFGSRGAASPATWPANFPDSQTTTASGGTDSCRVISCSTHSTDPDIEPDPFAMSAATLGVAFTIAIAGR